MDEELKDYLDRRFEEVIESSRSVQTEVLRAFHGWARPMEIRQRSVDERITLVEERVSEIERRQK